MQTGHSTTAPRPPSSVQRPNRAGRSRTFLALSLAISFTAFLGFSFTYFGPFISGTYPEASAMVHLHGWTFFLWYLLLPLQAGLIHRRRLRLHRRLGMASLALAAAMVGTGLVVISVRVEQALGPEGSPFWKMSGLAIFFLLVLFALFYALGMRDRRNGPRHKRFMILASTAALGAATFRILTPIFRFSTWVFVAGILAPNLFVIAGMLADYRQQGRIHPVYVYGLILTVLVEAAAVPLTNTAPGQLLSRTLAAVGQASGFLY